MFYKCSIFTNKKWQETSYKKTADLSIIIRQISMNNYKSMILMHPKKCYYLDQETPMGKYWNI